MRIDNVQELTRIIAPALSFDNQSVEIRDEHSLRTDAAERLARSALSGSPGVAEAASWLIAMAHQSMGRASASLAGLHRAIARGDVGGFVIPIISVPCLPLEIARSLFRTAKDIDTGIILFSSPSESETGLRAFAAAILAAAIMENWILPVFLHAEISLPTRAAPLQNSTPTAEMKKRIREAIDAQIFNLELKLALSESSGIRGGSWDPRIIEQLASKIEMVVSYIRGRQPAGIRISIGCRFSCLSDDYPLADLCSIATETLERCKSTEELSTVAVQLLPGASGRQRVRDAVQELETFQAFHNTLRTEFKLTGASWVDNERFLGEKAEDYSHMEPVSIHFVAGVQNELLTHPRFPATSPMERLAPDLQSMDDGTKQEFIDTLSHTFFSLFDELSLRGTFDCIRQHVIPIQIYHKRPNSM